MKRTMLILASIMIIFSFLQPIGVKGITTAEAAPLMPLNQEPPYPPREPEFPDPAINQTDEIIYPPALNDLAMAMDIPASSIVNVHINGSSTAGLGVGDAPLGYNFPQNNGQVLILSTGNADYADDPNTTGNLSTTLTGLNNVQGNDMVQLWVELEVPGGANCASFDFAFFSEEFPEFVGSRYNDGFTAEKGGSDLSILNDQIVSPLNFALDASGQPISVNTVSGVTSPTDSTYDGMTPIRRASTGVEPGTVVWLVFSVQDLGDSVYDSAVFLDDFSWSYDPACGGYVEPPPAPQGSLILQMAEALPLEGSIYPWVTVYNPYAGAAQYQIRIQLWHGFSKIDERTQDVSFTVSGNQSFGFDFGVYSPGYYYIWAELWQFAELLEFKTQSFVVGQDYLRLYSNVRSLSNAAYSEVNDGEDIAVQTLAETTVAISKETIEFLSGKLASWVLGLGDLGEVDASILGDAATKLTTYIQNFDIAYSQSGYPLAENYWRNDMNQRGFNTRRDTIGTQEQTVLDKAIVQEFTWNPAWEPMVASYRSAILSKNESDESGLGFEPSLSWPFFHRATLTQLRGQFEWVKDDVIPFLERWATVILIILVVVLVVGFILLILINAGVTLPAVILSGAKLIIALQPVIIAAMNLLKNLKVIAILSSLFLMSLFVSDTAKEYVSKHVVEEHGQAMEFIMDQAALDRMAAEGTVDTKLFSQDGVVYANSEVTALYGEVLVNSHLFRADGQLMSIIEHGIQADQNKLVDEYKLAPGGYWVIGVALTRDGISASRSEIVVDEASANLEVSLAQPQVEVGHVVEAQIDISNPDPVTAIEDLALSITTLKGTYFEVKFFDLPAGGTRSYEINYLAQEAGADILRVALGDATSKIAQVDSPFVVGEGDSVAINFDLDLSYQPGDITWGLEFQSIGLPAGTHEISFTTHKLNQGYELVHEGSVMYDPADGQQQFIPLNVILDGKPGQYVTNLYLDGEFYRAEEYLVEAEGALFMTVTSDQEIYNLTETVGLTITVFDESFTGIDASVSATLKKPDQSESPLVLVRQETGIYRVEFPIEIAGTHEIILSAEKENYSGTGEAGIVIGVNPSLLIPVTTGQLIYDQPTEITVGVTNEWSTPIAQANIIVDTTEGLVTGLTDETGMVTLLVKAVTTEPLAARIQKTGYLTANLEFPVAVAPDQVGPALSLILPSVTNQSILTVEGWTEPGAVLAVQGENVSVDSSGNFIATISLSPGMNEITSQAHDQSMNVTTITSIVTLDQTAPTLEIVSPVDGFATVEQTVLILGRSEPGAVISIGDTISVVDEEGQFRLWFTLPGKGWNTLVVKAEDQAHNISELSQMILVWNQLFLPVGVTP